MSQIKHDKILCIRVVGSEQAIRALLTKHPTETYALKHVEKAVSVELFLPEQIVELLDRKALQVEILHDASARGRERQKEVGTGNRFLGERKTFEGLGIKARGNRDDLPQR